MTERLANRHGASVPVEIRRFIIKEGQTLQPGNHCQAKLLHATNSSQTNAYQPSDNDYLNIEVYSTFNRAFARAGECGWALFNPLNHRWEVISMEGSLLRHGKAYARIEKNASGQVAIWYNNEDVGEITTAFNVTVFNNSDDAVATNDKVFIWFEPVSEQWYIVGGSGGSGGTVVSVYSTTADGNCLWAGKVATKPAAVITSACSDQFTEGADCWLLVLNSVLGSTAGSHVKLAVGDKYLASKVATIGTGESARDVYAIRFDQNDIYPVTIASPGIGPGLTGDVGLPDGRTVTATNWTSYTLNDGDPATAYQSRVDATWSVIGGTAPPASSTKIYPVTLAGDVIPGDAITVTLPDTSTVSATNWSKGNMLSGDKVTAYQQTGGGPWYLIKSEDRIRSQFIEFSLNEPLGIAQHSASAAVLTHWGYGDNIFADIEGSDVDVVNSGSSTGFKGLEFAFGYAAWNEILEEWEILSLEPPALIIEAVLGSGFVGGTSVGAAVNHYYQGQNPGAFIDIYDIDNFFPDAAPGDAVRAIYDDATEVYRIINCEPHTITLDMVVSVTLSSATQLRIQTRPVKVLSAGVSTIGFIDLPSGTNQPTIKAKTINVVTDVTCAGGVITKTTTPVKVLCDNVTYDSCGGTPGVAGAQTSQLSTGPDVGDVPPSTLAYYYS